jgi:hypothetical protein
MRACIEPRTGLRRRLLVPCLRFAAIAALAAAGSMPARADSDTFHDKLISLGTATKSGIFHVVGSGLCDTVNEDRQTKLVRCVPYNTTGAEYNAKAVAYGELTMGITLPDIAQAEFKKKKATDRHGADLRAVMSLHAKPVMMIVRKASKITDVTQLRGHTINLGNVGSGQRVFVDIILKELGLSTSDFSAAVEQNTSQMGKSFCSGSIDVIVESLGNWSPFYQTMIEECGGMILPFPQQMIDHIVAKYPLMSRLTIPGGLYAGQTQPISTFGYRALLVTSAKVSDEAVSRFVGSVVEHIDDLRKYDRELSDLDPARMFSDGITIPLHPGVTRYLSNRNLAITHVKSDSR